MLHRGSVFQLRQWLARVVYGAAFGTMLVLTSPIATAADNAESIRGYWLSSAALDSPETIRRALATIQSTSYDTVFVPIAAADADERAGFDGTREFIKDARERGLHVHAWIAVNRVSSADEFPASRANVIYQHPEWLMVPRALAPEMFAMDPRGPAYLGRLSRWTRLNRPRVDGLYLSPLDPEASSYVTDLIASTVRRYGVDGVFLDAVQFPGNDFDYSRHAMDMFRAEVRPRLTASERARLDDVEAIDTFGYASEFPDEWSQFRQARLTALVARLRATLKTVNPQLTVTLHASSDADNSRAEQFQDWSAWVANRLVDGIGRHDGNDATIILSTDGLIPLPVVLPSGGQVSVGGSR